MRRGERGRDRGTGPRGREGPSEDGGEGEGDKWKRGKRSPFAHRLDLVRAVKDVAIDFSLHSSSFSLNAIIMQESRDKGLADVKGRRQEAPHTGVVRVQTQTESSLRISDDVGDVF